MEEKSQFRRLILWEYSVVDGEVNWLHDPAILRKQQFAKGRQGLGHCYPSTYTYLPAYHISTSWASLISFGDTKWVA